MRIGVSGLMPVILTTVAGCASSPPTTSVAAAPGAGREPIDFREIVQNAKDRVFPAVVYIKCRRESHESGKKEITEVSGSGVVIAPDGKVVTNWHVVDKAVEVRCLLYDGRAAAAKVLGTDKDTDLALLQLSLADGDGPLPHAALGDSDRLREGDFVMAMGAPWGLNRSVSIGIVSCTRRFLPGNSQYSLWLQTDAAISPGNSGGPLVNTTGEVVGINSLGYLQGGDMAFAVPSNTVRHVVSELEQHGRVNWSWTGLQLQALKDFNRNIYFDATAGVIVAETDRESPARRAGIQPKDRILKINGAPITALTEENLPGVRRRIGLLPKEKAARFEIVRDGEARVVPITPREKGKVEGQELDFPRWDFTCKAINQFDNPDLYFYRTEGVFVFGIKYPGNASNAGLRDKDIVLKVDNAEITTLDDLKRAHEAALAGIENKHRIVLTVLRNGLLRQIVLDFARDYEKE